MAKFLYLYTGGEMAETPEAQEEQMQEWTAWFGTLGDSVVDMGNPFGASSTVTQRQCQRWGSAPSWAATRSSTPNPWRRRRRRLTDVRSCSPVAPLRCTKHSPCDPGFSLPLRFSYLVSASSAADATSE